MSTSRILIAALLLFTAACAPVVSSAPISTMQPRRAPTMSRDVILYVGKAPTCDFTELAYIEGASNSLTTMSKTFASMRAKAATYGANGLMLSSHEDTGGGHNRSSSTTQHSQTGVAIVTSCNLR